MEKLVVVRDFAGRPLKRVLIGEGPGLVYVASPDLVGAVNSGESYPVGFPAQDAYLFESYGFSCAVHEYEVMGQVSQVGWEKLKPYSVCN